MQRRNISEQELENDIRLINAKLNIIKAAIKNINVDASVTIDGKPQNLKSMLEGLFPPSHVNIDRTNLIDYWDDTNKLDNWETTLDKITVALLADDRTSQMTLRGKRHRSGEYKSDAAKASPTLLDQIFDIASHADTLRKQVKLLCTNYYGAAQETKDKRKTVLMNAPIATLERMHHDESELKFAARRMKSGDPALNAVNDLLSSDKSRETVLSLTNSNYFKHKVYEKSIENMARSILKEDRELFAPVDPSELADIRLREPMTGAETELKGTCVTYSNHFDQLSWRVAKDILKHEGKNKDAAQIAFSIDYWINVAYELAYNPNLPDLHGAMAIIYGLSLGSLTSILKIVMSSEEPLISDKTREKYEKLTALCDLSHEAQAPEAFAKQHPNAIIPLVLLQKKLKYADGRKEPREPLLASFQKHIIGASGASIPNTNYASNIGEVGIKEELDAASDAITVITPGEERKFAKKVDSKKIESQLAKVKIKRDTTLTEETAETKIARLEAAKPVDYAKYPILIKRETNPLHTEIDAALKSIGLVVAANADQKDSIIDIYDAAKTLCEGGVSDKTSKLMAAPALIRAIAIAHYIVNTEQPDSHAMELFNMALQQQSTTEKESFFNFIEKLPPYKQKFEDSDLIVSEFVEINVAPKQSAFPPFTKKKEKQGGANDAGNYGGVYYIKEDEVLFKSEPDKEKVQGECFTGLLVANTLQNMHANTDSNYSNKFVAKVSLEVAVDVDEVEKKQFSEKSPMPADFLLYLKSEFISNIGDFWTVAMALADDRFKAFQNLPADQRIEQLKILAEQIKKNRGNNRPAALFKSYDHPDITVPSNFIKDNGLLKQFCEMIAARLLFADFGVHNGNFVIIAKPSADNKNIIFELGCIDFGAGLDELTSQVKPFEKKSFMKGFKFTFYKNHLLDYTPEISKSTEMAKAFILAGKESNEQIKQNINLVITEEHAKASIETLQKLCVRMQMPEELYKGENNKPDLLKKMRQFVYKTSIMRKDDLRNIGYGLLIENCFVDKNGKFDANAPLNLQLLNKHIAAYPELLDYVKNDLSSYEPNRGLAKNRFKDVKAYCDKDPLVLQKLENVKSGFDELTKNLQTEISALTTLKQGIKDKSIEPEKFTAKDYDSVNFEYLTIYRKCIESHAKFNHEYNYQIPDINVPAQKALAQLSQLTEELNVLTGKASKPVERATKPVEPKAVIDKNYVLTIGMLGTSEHRDQGATLIKQLCDSVEQSKYQSAYLIDGVGAKPSDDKSQHPMLGTYDVTDCVRDKNGNISVTKVPKSFGACSQAMGLVQGKGTHDAIAEAMLVIETMLNDRDDKSIPLTINLAGFSRGADNTVRLANAIAEKYTRKEVIVNIFALDPVPGPKRSDATKARLIPDIVQNYEVVLMRNETRELFKPRDKRHITVQNPNSTNVKYHLYRGVHSQGNYFYTDPLAASNKLFDAKLDDTVINAEAARMVSNDLSLFAKENGIKLKDQFLPHIEYAKSKNRKLVQAVALDDEKKLASYTRMLQANFDPEQKKRSKKAKDAPARDFTNNLSDYFLHGREFFIDRTHMELVFARLTVKDNINGKIVYRYGHVLDYLFQGGIEHGIDGTANAKFLEEFKLMQTQDPDLYYCLKDFPDPPEHDPGWRLIAPRNVSAKGIPVRVSTFYQPGNPLNKQWELLIAALSPVFIDQDHSLSVKDAASYYERAKAILESKEGYGSLDAREASKTKALQEIVLEINAKKIEHELAKSKAADKSKVMINAVCAKLERALAKKKSYPNVYKDIVQGLREAAKEIESKHLGHDPQLVNQLLNEALHAINATESEYKGGSNYFKKAIRESIILIAAVDAPILNVDQLTHASNIQSAFASKLKMNTDTVEMVDNPTYKPASMPAPSDPPKDTPANPAVDDGIDPAIASLRACTANIIQMLRGASEKMSAESRLPDDDKRSFAPRKDAQSVKIEDTPVHRFFYRNPHDTTTPVVNPFEPPKFDFL